MKVIVNPNYRGNGWFDTAAKISFVKREEPYEIPKEINDVHIKKHLALGYLLEVKPKEELQSETLQPIVTSSFKELVEEETKEAEVNGVQEKEEKEKIVEPKEEIATEEPTAEVKEEAVKEEPAKEKPKTKRGTKKKKTEEKSE